MFKFILEYGIKGKELTTETSEFMTLQEAVDKAHSNAIDIFLSTDEGMKLKDKIYSQDTDIYRSLGEFSYAALPYIEYKATEHKEIKENKNKFISEVYDIEVLSNIFTYTGYDRQEKKYYQFVIHSSRNDYEKLIEHLFRGKLIMVGYNNDNYDYPIIHHMINHYEEYKYLNGRELAQKIYDKSQSIIEERFSSVADKNKHIVQIDLFKIWHYDNMAKLTSLKSLQIAMNLPLVEDMPYSHTHWVTTEEEIEEILSYNKNDVYATSRFLDITQGDTDNILYKGKSKLELRSMVRKKFGINCMNQNDILLGTELILKLYTQKFNINPYNVRKNNTPRAIIDLKDCLPAWMKFQTNKFDSLINTFKNTKIYNGETKGKLAYSVIYHGIKIDYGTGGAHACIKPGVYNADEEYGIYDLDIDSLYPMLAISQGLYPEHLGPGFLDIYDKEIVSVRLKEKKKSKKERDFVIIEGFKLAANGAYGKTNEEKSWLYDPLYAMKTTVSGQLFISMWTEFICENIPDVTVLQINTDGITFKLPKKYKEKLLELSTKISSDCGLTYEMNEYDRMVIRDVNNYSARYLDGGIKHKGAFEIDKELHKDPSMRIVPIALEKYFFEGVPIRETIRNHNNIYDFCLRLKVNKSVDALYEHLENSELKSDLLGNNIRYYVSVKGGSLVKKFINNNDKRIGVNVGFIVTIFNKYEEKEMKDYNIDYNFYISECSKIINIVESKQLSLF